MKLAIFAIVVVAFGQEVESDIVSDNLSIEERGKNKKNTENVSTTNNNNGGIIDNFIQPINNNDNNNNNGGSQVTLPTLTQKPISVSFK